MTDAPKPTLEELRAARVRLTGTMNGMHFDDAVVISGRLLDAAIAKAEREESGEFVQVWAAAAVAPDGRWHVQGFYGSKDEEMQDDAAELVDSHERPPNQTAVAMITALVPIPQPVEIEGEAEDA